MHLRAHRAWRNIDASDADRRLLPTVLGCDLDNALQQFPHVQQFNFLDTGGDVLADPCTECRGAPRARATRFAAKAAVTAPTFS